MRRFRRSRRRSSSVVLLNLLSVLFLIGAVCVGGMAMVVFINPQVLPENFQPPPPLPTVPQLPTSTPTPVQQLPPTWTPLPTHTPIPTPTRPPSTPLPSPTPFTQVTPPTSAPTPTFPTEGFAYALQPDNPIAIQNVTHPELGCNWMGVAGQVFDLNGAPVVSILVQLGGSLLGIPIDLLTLTGTATQYGPAGYEFTIIDKPVASSGDLYVQLLDQNGLPLSDKIFFDTYDDCDRALILINFTQVR